MLVFYDSLIEKTNYGITIVLTVVSPSTYYFHDQAYQSSSVWAKIFAGILRKKSFFATFVVASVGIDLVDKVLFWFQNNWILKL